MAQLLPNVLTKIENYLNALCVSIPSEETETRTKDDYQWRLVKAILGRHGASPTDFVPYRNFFKEVSAKRTVAMDKESQKVRVDQIKAKYEKLGLKPAILNEIAKLVPLKVTFPD